MAKSLLIIVFCCLVFNFTACSNENSETISSFFVWMDSYISLAENSSSSIALTCFFENNKEPFKKEHVYGLRFDGIEDKVQITSFNIEEKESSNLSSKYSSYYFYIDYETLEKGIFQTENILINLSNSESLKYPIGSWIFDIDKHEEGEFINTWESPAASQNNSELVYDYKINDSKAKIEKIWFNIDSYISDESGLLETGTFKILNEEVAPVNYIKTKIELDVDGNHVVAYGKGCYCGASNSESSIIELSKEYATKNIYLK